MKKQIPSSLLHNQKGSITVQFVFGFLLVFSFIIGFFYLSLTLVISELVQYATFSSSRYLSLSHRDVQRQETESQNKYRDLLFASSSSGGIFRSGFFGVINGDDKPFNLEQDISNNQGVNQNMPGMQLGDRNLFYGVWTEFQPKGLNLKMPFWGESVQNPEENLFDSVIGSYLGREPSQEECTAFARDRWKMIKDKINPNPPRGFSGNGDSGAYTYSGVNNIHYDNGC